MDPDATYPARRDVPWDEIEGRIVLALPRRMSLAQSLVARLFPLGATQLVTLEGASADFWRLCDGTRSLRAIADQFPEVPMALARAERFVEDIERRGYLVTSAEPARATDALRGLTHERGYAQARCRRCQRLQPMRIEDATAWYCAHCRKLNRPRPTPRGP